MSLVVLIYRLLRRARYHAERPRDRQPARWTARPV